MLEEPHFLGSDRHRIVVQTRRGYSLENFVAPKPDQQASNFFQLLVKEHGKNWRQRINQAVGVYNCAGLVWASRRTVLPNPNEWQRIIDDDGYRPLRIGEKPYIGDIAIYRARHNHEIIHIARVCAIQKLDVPHHVASEGTPWALSKWDLKSGESYHAVADVYLNGGEPFDLSYVTDRI